MPDVLLLLLGLSAFAVPEPVRDAWIRSSASPAGQALARVLPEVHEVQVDDRLIEVRSAGISLYNFGILQYPVKPQDRLRDIRVRIPRFPSPQPEPKTSVPSGTTGLFLNGVPIPNQLQSESFEGRNLWHYDLLAMHSQDPHAAPTPLLSNLLNDSSRPSPIIGFALDGYPIYGRPMRSSYRLRSIDERSTLPDGKKLTPGQYGPRIGSEYPLGTFSEDYEFMDGLGELDRFNGRFTKTREYPQGTYAYFLSTDEQGRMAFPYLLSSHYYGKTDTRTDACASIGERPHVTMRTCSGRLAAGEPVSFSFTIRDDRGRPVSALEYVHEKPIHLILVSEDLAEFAHIHPERAAGDSFIVEHTVQHGGRYRLYADFTPAGSRQHIEEMDVNVAGSLRSKAPFTAVRDARVTLSAPEPLRAGVDQLFHIRLRDTSGQEPYLGAWGHFVLIDEQKSTFIHAHPMDGVSSPARHSHAAIDLGPPPDEIRFQTGFPHAGRYKLWAQFQIDGKVEVFPFVLRVSRAAPLEPATAPIPNTAVPLRVGPDGFDPPRLEIPAKQSIQLAITRSAQSNCASKIVFPDLGITRELPLGQTVLIDIPAQPAGEFRFACGMGMYRGIIVAR